MPESVKRRGSSGPTIGATVQALLALRGRGHAREAYGARHGGRCHAATVRGVVVRVRLFAMLRQRAGRDALELELPDGARVADALAAVDDLAGGLPLVLAVNREYAAPEQVLRRTTSWR